jgi:hypothetical protein
MTALVALNGCCGILPPRSGHASPGRLFFTSQGRAGVIHADGTGKDSEASEATIKILDKPDDRPVWFCVWGDCANTAQAIWKVRSTRSPGGVRTFLSKIRIHQIARQDETTDWLLKNFPICRSGTI